MKKIIMLCLSIFIFLPFSVQARRGCCSHHGGVAGCSSSGRQICSDGTLSPSCTCTPSYQYGCTDKSAKNYNANANRDDGSCVYYKYGCTDQSALNYDASAEKNDGSCITIIYGCMDKSAVNYSSAANKDDGSCEYQKNVDMKIEKEKSYDFNSKNQKEENNVQDNPLLGFGILGAFSYLLFKKKRS